MGQDQVSGGVSVLCWLAAPVAMFHGNLQNSIIKSISVLKSNLPSNMSRRRDMYQSLCSKTSFERPAHLGKNMSMQHSFREFTEKQRRVELQFIGFFVVKTVLVESSNQVSLEELCRTQYNFTYLSKPYRPSVFGAAHWETEDLKSTGITIEIHEKKKKSHLSSLLMVEHLWKLDKMYINSSETYTT